MLIVAERKKTVCKWKGSEDWQLSQAGRDLKKQNVIC